VINGKLFFYHASHCANHLTHDEVQAGATIVDIPFIKFTRIEINLYSNRIICAFIFLSKITFVNSSQTIPNLIAEGLLLISIQELNVLGRQKLIDHISLKFFGRRRREFLDLSCFQNKEMQ
jgi:hypothetical protein